jgi:GAF domain-containing protein
MAHRRRAVTIDDLAVLARLSFGRHDPTQLYAAVDHLVQEIIGHKLFTLMRLHGTNEVERIYSSNEKAYPVGGRKSKIGTPWSAAVLDRGEIFVARNPGEVRAAFADHALIASLGIGSILNVPIGYRGQVLGTMNISHDAGWFTDDDAAAGMLVAAFIVPALVAD